MMGDTSVCMVNGWLYVNGQRIVRVIELSIPPPDSYAVAAASLPLARHQQGTCDRRRSSDPFATRSATGTGTESRRRCGSIFQFSRVCFDFAFLQRNQAVEQQHEAIHAVERARKEADQRRREAEKHRREAEQRRREADQRRREAEKRRREAEQRRREADQRRRMIEQHRNEARREDEQLRQAIVRFGAQVSGRECRGSSTDCTDESNRRIYGANCLLSDAPDAGSAYRWRTSCTDDCETHNGAH